jgi:hypothetical protein
LVLLAHYGLPTLLRDVVCWTTQLDWFTLVDTVGSLTGGYGWLDGLFVVANVFMRFVLVYWTLWCWFIAVVIVQ